MSYPICCLLPNMPSYHCHSLVCLIIHLYKKDEEGGGRTDMYATAALPFLSLISMLPLPTCALHAPHGPTARLLCLHCIKQATTYHQLSCLACLLLLHFVLAATF